MGYPEDRAQREYSKFANVGTGAAYSASQNLVGIRALNYGMTETGTGRPLLVTNEGKLVCSLG